MAKLRSGASRSASKSRAAGQSLRESFLVRSYQREPIYWPAFGLNILTRSHYALVPFGRRCSGPKKNFEAATTEPFDTTGKGYRALFTAVCPLVGLLAALFILSEVYGYGGNEQELSKDFGSTACGEVWHCV